MMQNNMMGAPAPATPQPTGLSFQSDPGMRSQFKGFMSGLQARQAPTQMMQPPMAMPNLPQQMAAVDIFQPVQSFAGGGSVPRATQIAGQPHMLSYITPGEAQVLKSLGGAGAPGPGGIPSFFYDEIGAVRGSTGNIGSGGQTQKVSAPSFNDIFDDKDDGTIGLNLPGGGTLISGNTIRGGTITGVDPMTLGDLFSLGGNDRTDPNQQTADALAAADASMPEVDALREQIQRKRQGQAALEQANRNAAMQGASQAIQSVIQGNQQKEADFQAARDAQMNLLDLGPEPQGLFDQRSIAEYITGRGGTVDVDPVTGQVTGNIDQIFDIDTTFAPYEIDGVSAPPSLPSAPPSRPAPSRPSFGAVGNEDAYGIGEFGEMGIAPIGGAADVLSRAAEKDAPMQRTPMEDIASRLTDITFEPGGRKMSSLEQLAMRAGQAPGFERTMQGKAANVPTIGSILSSLAGTGASGAMYNDITQKGYIPQYDARGQIVATIDPATGRLGRGSVAGRIDRNNSMNLNMNARRLPSQMPEEKDDAANPFLKLLGFEAGGEVKNFRGGGGVGRQDYEGASMSGVSGDVAGSSTSDVGSMGSQGQQASGLSFSGADLYGGDNDRQTVIATPVTAPPPDATGGQLVPQSQDVVPATVPEGEFLEPLSSAPKNMIQTQAGAIDPASMSLSEKASLIGEGLGNLLDFDLFSAPEVDADLAARLEAAGFSPETVKSATTPSSVGDLFTIPESVPTPASLTDYKQYATTPETKIDMGNVDMRSQTRGLGDMFSGVLDYVSNLDVIGNKIDTSNFGGLGASPFQ